MKITFRVDEPLLAYRASRSQRRTKTGRKTGGVFDPAYSAYKARVLALAMAAGWRGRVSSLVDHPPRLSVFVMWKTAPRADWKNVYGAIEDALFTQDRYVIPGDFCGAKWDAMRIAKYTGPVYADVTVEV